MTASRALRSDIGSDREKSRKRARDPALAATLFS